MGYLTRVEDAAASIFFDSDKVLALAAASTLLAGAKLKLSAKRVCELSNLKRYDLRISLNMLEFMDYIQHAFYNVSGWNFENSYSQLTATARGNMSPSRSRISH